MGLDVTWYRGLKAAPDATVDDDGNPEDWEQFVRLRTGGDYPERCSDIVSGIYTAHDQGRFRAGSYSGYNNWREALAKLAGYPACDDGQIGHRHSHSETVWRNPKPGPFVELIDFTDCDGLIGTAVAGKLAGDFAQFQAAADRAEDRWFTDQYVKFRDAFEQAADAGAVQFH